MPSKNIANALNHHDLVSDSTLHVVTAISNPAKFNSRFRIYREYEKVMLATPNVVLYTIELAHGDSHFEVTDPSNPRHLQIRSNSQIWAKENLINIAFKKLVPHSAKYYCWSDGDIFFANSDWALQTVHALQFHHIVQPFSESIDLGPHNNVLKVYRSFASLVYGGETPRVHTDEYYPYDGHTGYVWASTSEWFQQVHGLIDWAIVGSGDYHMAHGMIGQIDGTVVGNIPDTYLRMCKDWQQRAMQLTNGAIGVVKGHITHSWHGRKSKRGYETRSKILIDNQFDPIEDLRRDAAGLYYVHNKPKMIEDLHHYARSREEDEISEE